MIRPVHYEVEVLYGCVFQPACENAAGRDAFDGPEVEMTTLDEEVTCRDCLKTLGYDIAPDTGYVRIAA